MELQKEEKPVKPKIVTAKPEEGKKQKRFSSFKAAFFSLAATHKQQVLHNDFFTSVIQLVVAFTEVVDCFGAYKYKHTIMYENKYENVFYSIK